MVKQSTCLQKKELNWESETHTWPLPFKTIHYKLGRLYLTE